MIADSKTKELITEFKSKNAGFFLLFFEFLFIKNFHITSQKSFYSNSSYKSYFTDSNYVSSQIYYSHYEKRRNISKILNWCLSF